jgi:lysozyme
VTITGIDISNNNGHVDLGKVRGAGYAFVGMKASGDEGGGANHFLDGFFARNWKAAGEQGLARLAYHYARPSVATPSQSVTTLQEAVAAAGGLGPGDTVALDLEDPAVPDGTSLHVWAAEWLDLAARVFGVAPWKYSARYYTSTHDLEHDDLAAFPTWWASYQAHRPAPVTGWGPIRIWQHDAHTTVPGVQGECDVNVFDGSHDDLRSLGRASTLDPLFWTTTPAIPPLEAGRPDPRPDPRPARSVPSEVVAALDTIWEFAGPDVEVQKAIVALKVKLGLQADG